jgi:molybdopterin-guanine dinucleotide biosynthesis protein A
MPQLVGVVLAGGTGRRMGRSKGSLLVGGRTLASAAAASVWPLCGTVLVSLEEGAVHPAPEHPSVADRPPAGRGPLAGIQAAFEETGTADLLVLACDYPFVDTSFLRTIVESAGEEHDLVMATDSAGRDHPLVGLWRRRTERRVTEALDGGRYKVRSLLAEMEVRRLGPEEFPGRDLDRVLRNLNTPEDLVSLGLA